MTAIGLASDDPVVVDLRRLCSRAQRFEEGGHVYYSLPNLFLGDGARPEQCDALLRIGGCDGYSSRIFLAAKVDGKPLNWNSEAFIVQRRWFAFSWKVADGLTGLRLLSAHLRAFR